MVTSTLLKSLTTRLTRAPIIKARLRSLVSRKRLPPGDWIDLDKLERSNRCFLLEQADRFGPIFKALAWGEPWISVLGLGRGRRLLRDHGTELKPMTLDLQPLFPKGFLRQMQGDSHRQYRQALNSAIRPEDFSTCRPELARLAATHLAAYATLDDHSPDDYISTLNSIASGMLVRLFFGASTDTTSFEQLMEGYQKLGPYGLVWNIGPAQVAAFNDIRDQLQEESKGTATLCASSILGRLCEGNSLDETLLGNLIYMVEMGRYDTYSLFRWLSKYAADFPEFLERIAEETERPPEEEKTFTEAFVLETLRMDQSERLQRKVQNDFVFEGYLFPKGSTVRICLWESHKAPDAFPDPMRFDPERFLAGNPGSDEFAPFGLDRHQCPFGNIAIRTAVLFVQQLALGYHVIPSGDGLPIRGAYHWEPASSYSVRLAPRNSPARP
ncbi:MAG: cytochrome P450 [Verrucomicrobiales bacterium]